MSDNDNLVKRTYYFYPQYVSCLHCACNYGATSGNKTFCQVFSTNIVPQEVEKNKTVARNCTHFVPDKSMRSMIKTDDYKTWYEDIGF